MPIAHNQNCNGLHHTVKRDWRESDGNENGGPIFRSFARHEIAGQTI